MWKENTLSLGKPEMGGIYSTGATGVSRDDTNERDTFALSSPAGGSSGTQECCGMRIIPTGFKAQEDPLSLPGNKITPKALL